jgi:hypothetical protein
MAFARAVLQGGLFGADVFLCVLLPLMLDASYWSSKN